LDNYRRVLLIGGLGFLGKNLYINLKQAGYTTHILSDILPDSTDYFLTVADSNDIIQGDFRDTKLLTDLIPNYSYVFCFAGLSGAKSSLNRPIEDNEINCIAHLNFLEVCKKVNPNVHIVFPSTRLVYGKPQYLPVDEKHPLEPESLYAVHKLTAEYYYKIYFKIYNIRSIILRISNPYGPFQSFNNASYGILNWFIYQALRKKEIKLFGKGDQKRDYLFINDLADLMIRLIENPELFNSEVYNVGFGRGISLYEGLMTIKKHITDLTITMVPWPDTEGKIETGDYYSNIGAISEKTGWQPTTTFDQGIQKTIDFYKKIIDI